MGKKSKRRGGTGGGKKSRQAAGAGDQLRLAATAPSGAAGPGVTPADALAQTMGQTLGCGAGGQSARLQHHDPARDLIQQGQRHPRRLARPRRRDQNRAAMRGQGRAKRRQNVFDGQAVGHPQGYAKAPARAKARAAIYEIARMAPIFGATTKGWQAEWVSAAI